MLVIDPEECIDCALCETECPVDAIVSDEHIPVDQTALLRLNAELAQRWPAITLKKPPPDDADQWRGRSGKRALLEA